MYTQMNTSKNLNIRIRRLGDIWKKIASVMLTIAGIYTVMLVGKY